MREIGVLYGLISERLDTTSRNTKIPAIRHWVWAILFSGYWVGLSNFCEGKPSHFFEVFPFVFFVLFVVKSTEVFG